MCVCKYMGAHTHTHTHTHTHSHTHTHTHTLPEVELLNRMHMENAVVQL